MRAKLEAAQLAASSGTRVVIANGREPNAIVRIAGGEQIGTCVPAVANVRESRKRWLLAGLGEGGALVLDAGAARAIGVQGRSLLPAGIVAVDGRFERGDIVALRDPEGAQIGVGLSNYSAADIERIRGESSTKMSPRWAMTSAARSCTATTSRCPEPYLPGICPAMRPARLASKALNNSPPAKRGEIPQAEGGLRFRLTAVAVSGRTGSGPPLSLRDISPRSAGGEEIRIPLTTQCGQRGGERIRLVQSVPSAFPIVGYAPRMPELNDYPASHTYFSQRLRLHYVDWGNPDAPPLISCTADATTAARGTGWPWHCVTATT